MPRTPRITALRTVVARITASTAADTARSTIRFVEFRIGSSVRLAPFVAICFVASDLRFFVHLDCSRDHVIMQVVHLPTLLAGLLLVTSD